MLGEVCLQRVVFAYGLLGLDCWCEGQTSALPALISPCDDVGLSLTAAADIR